MQKSAKKPTNMQWGLDAARKKALLIVEPKPNQLQIDIDGCRALRAHGMTYSILRKAGLTAGWRSRISPSKSGKNRVHITITTPTPMNNTLRVAFQAILGSDIKREAFNLCRVLNGGKYPIVFFERSKTGTHSPTGTHRR